MNKPKPKYNKIPFTEWLEKHKDLNFLIENRVLVAISGVLLELVVKDVADAPKRFDSNGLNKFAFLADDGQWRSIVSEQIWYILEEIEYDKELPKQEKGDIDHMKNLMDEWKKHQEKQKPIRPPVEPIRPWYPSQPYHPNCPGYPAYPGWKPEVWCSTSTIFREDT